MSYLAAAATLPAQAQDKGYEAMLVKCIDPRFTTNTWAYMASRSWQNLYSQFNIAGLTDYQIAAQTFTQLNVPGDEASLRRMVTRYEDLLPAHLPLEHLGLPQLSAGSYVK